MGLSKSSDFLYNRSGIVKVSALCATTAMLVMFSTVIPIGFKAEAKEVHQFDNVKSSDITLTETYLLGNQKTKKVKLKDSVVATNVENIIPFYTDNYEGKVSVPAIPVSKANITLDTYLKDGQEYSLDNIKVELEYSDGTKKEVTAEDGLAFKNKENIQKLNKGSNKVNLTYFGYDMSFDVEVK